MTIDTTTQENPEPTDTKVVDLDDLLGPEILTPEGIFLPATHRCDRCGAQAWVEVESVFTRLISHNNTEHAIGSGEALLAEDVTNELDTVTTLFCAHHFGQHEDKVKATAKRIVDYRPNLIKQEKAGGPAL